MYRKNSVHPFFVRITGLEPARHGHQNLNLARLPIPPYPQNIKPLFKVYLTVAEKSMKKIKNRC